MGTFRTCLKLKDFETSEKVGGEEAEKVLKIEAKLKIKQPQTIRRREKYDYSQKQRASNHGPSLPEGWKTLRAAEESGRIKKFTELQC